MNEDYKKLLEVTQKLSEAALATSVRRYRGSSLEPCWCQIAGNNCIGQIQCHVANDALKSFKLIQKTS